MERLCGFIQDGYRFEVQVPTTIYDPQRAHITAYYKAGAVADQIFFKLHEMPTWNVPNQAIFLSKEDMKTLEKRTAELCARLPERAEYI